MSANGLDETSCPYSSSKRLLLSVSLPLNQLFCVLQVSWSFRLQAGLSDSQYLEFLTVADITTHEETTPIILLAHVNIEVDIFQMHTDEDETLRAVDAASGDTSIKDEESITPQATITCLPSRSLQGVWESYVPLTYSLLSAPWTYYVQANIWRSPSLPAAEVQPANE